MSKTIKNEIESFVVREIEPDAPVVEEVRPKKKRSKLRAFVEDHPGMVVGTVYGLVLIGCGIKIVKDIKGNRLFSKEIKAKYGESVTEGHIFGGSPKKLWDHNKVFEEEYKGNFDKVANCFRGLELKPFESYSVDRVKDNGGLLKTELIQFHEGGFYHGEIL